MLELHSCLYVWLVLLLFLSSHRSLTSTRAWHHSHLKATLPIGDITYLESRFFDCCFTIVSSKAQLDVLCNVFKKYGQFYDLFFELCLIFIH